jgi:uncharacterized Zn-finger protein
MMEPTQKQLEFKCDKCGKPNKSKKAVWRHLKESCSKTTRTKFACPSPSCDKVFVRKYLLDKHAKLCNSGPSSSVVAIQLEPSSTLPLAGDDFADFVDFDAPGLERHLEISKFNIFLTHL